MERQEIDNQPKVQPEQMALFMSMVNQGQSFPLIASVGTHEKEYNSDSSNDQQQGQKRRGRPRRDPNAPKKKRGAIEYDPEGDSCTRILREWRKKKELEKSTTSAMTQEEKLQAALENIRRQQQKPLESSLKLENSQHLRAADVKLNRDIRRHLKANHLETEKQPIKRVVKEQPVKQQRVQTANRPSSSKNIVTQFHNFDAYSNVRR